MDVLYTDYNSCLGSKDDQIIYRTTKIGDVTVSQWKTVPEGAPGMPPIPVSYQGDTAISNSDALRAWVEGPAPSGSGNMLDYFIVDNFGQDIWNQTFGSKDYKQFKVVFEPLFWFRPVNAQKQILNSTQGGKTWVYGTSWNIAQWENSYLEWIGNNTGGWMKNATNKLFPTSFYLSTSDSELGLKTPSKLGLLTTEELLDYSQGYGMQKMKDRLNQNWMQNLVLALEHQVNEQLFQSGSISRDLYERVQMRLNHSADAEGGDL